MKLKHLISLCCCAAVMALSCLSVSAAPEDSSYLDDIYDWISSTASDLWDEYNSSDGSDSADSSDSSEYYEQPTEGYEDTSSEYYEEPTYDYYEDEPESSYYEPEPTEPPTEYAQANEDTSSDESRWYDWFAVSPPETEPVTDPVIEETAEDSETAGTFEYVGYGFLMWVVIIVGVIITLAILTNTHLRKKS